MSLSERLREAMQDAGISQADLARACGVKPPSIHGWLSGKSKFLRGENLLLAAAALNVSDVWLATGKGSKARDQDAQDVSAMRPAAASVASADTATQIVNLLSSIPPGVRPVAGKLLESLASTPDDPALQKLLRDVINSGGQK